MSDLGSLIMPSLHFYILVVNVTAAREKDLLLFDWALNNCPSAEVRGPDKRLKHWNQW